MNDLLGDLAQQLPQVTTIIPNHFWIRPLDSSHPFLEGPPVPTPWLTCSVGKSLPPPG